MGGEKGGWDGVVGQMSVGGGTGGTTTGRFHKVPYTGKC